MDGKPASGSVNVAAGRYARVHMPNA